MEISKFCDSIILAQDYTNSAVDELLEIVRKEGGSIDFSPYKAVRNCPYLMRDVFGDIGIKWLTSIYLEDGYAIAKSQDGQEDVMDYNDTLLLYNLSEIFDMLEWLFYHRK